MPAEPNVERAVLDLRDQLTAVADALVRGDVAALETRATVMGRLATTLGMLIATDAEPLADALLLSEARWALLRCQRLGLSLASLAGGPHHDGAPPTYLPTGARSSVPATPTAFEVSA